MDEQQTADLTEFLRRQKPARVTCVLRDGSRRDVACGTGRAARWGMTAATCAGMAEDLTAVELCDRDGALLDTWRPSTVSARDELEHGAPAAGPWSPEMALAVQVARLTQTAVDHAVDRHLRGLQSVVDGLTRIVQMQQERLREQDRNTSGVLRLAYDSVKVRAEAEAALRRGGDDDAGPADALLAQVLAQALPGPKPGP